MSSLSIDSVQLPFLARRLDAMREFYHLIVGLDEVACADGQRLRFALGEATLSLSPRTNSAGPSGPITSRSGLAPTTISSRG